MPIPGGGGLVRTQHLSSNTEMDSQPNLQATVVCNILQHYFGCGEDMKSQDRFPAIQLYLY